jgi:hypothetical protein
MKSKGIRILFLVFVAALMLGTISYAANESSLYLAGYYANISKTGNTIHVNFEVYGTRTMDTIGATEIYLYEKASGSSSWTLVETYLSTDLAYASAMIDTNTGCKCDSVSYNGSSSKQYKAYVTVYAEKDGGSDSRNIIAN